MDRKTYKKILNYLIETENPRLFEYCLNKWNLDYIDANSLIYTLTELCQDQDSNNNQPHSTKLVEYKELMHLIYLKTEQFSESFDILLSIKSQKVFSYFDKVYVNKGQSSLAEKKTMDHEVLVKKFLN